jgi:phage gpG-like protein
MAKKIGSDPEYEERYKKGMEKLRQQLAGIQRNNMQKAVLLIEADAKKMCPVKTGRLRASITSEVIPEGNTARGRVGTIEKYAAIVEFGIGRRAKPYLYPALRKNQRKIADMMTSDIKNIKGEDLR